MNEFDCDRMPKDLFDERVEDYTNEEEVMSFVSDSFERELFPLFEDRGF